MEQMMFTGDQNMLLSTREKLILILKQHKDEWISGELLSTMLNVSRAAISKHVRILNEEKYGIKSLPKKGYFLHKITPFMLSYEIRDGLNTKVLGQKEIFHSYQIDSTNRKAKQLAQDGAPEGTIVISETQTHGIGRKKRIWSSPTGTGIYASFIIRPSIPPNEAPIITLMTSVAMAEALSSLLQPEIEVKIKWPNDILINNKKLVGILTEITTDMDTIDYVVIGMGININTLENNFSNDVKNKATSLFIETGQVFSRVKIFQRFLQSFEKYYSMLKQGDFVSIMGKWHEFADIINKKISVDILGKTYTGDVLDVDNYGVLVLKDTTSNIHRIISGDVYMA